MRCGHAHVHVCVHVGPDPGLGICDLDGPVTRECRRATCRGSCGVRFSLVDCLFGVRCPLQSTPRLSYTVARRRSRFPTLEPCALTLSKSRSKPLDLVCRAADSSDTARHQLSTDAPLTSWIVVVDVSRCSFNAGSYAIWHEGWLVAPPSSCRLP